MTAPLPATAVHDCLRTAIAALVDRFGTAQVAQLCGINISTVRRHIAGIPWNDQEIAALIAAEIARSGRSTLIAALTTAADAGPAGESVRLQSDLVEEIREEGELVQATAAAIQKPTERTLRRLVDARQHHREHEAQVDADIAAAMARTA